jgi:hypothetical protein
MVGTLGYKIRKFKLAGIAIILCIMMALPAMAQYAQTPVLSQGSSSRVIFLEHYMLANGTVVQGSAPFKSINFPTYWYNENAHRINGKVDFPVNNSLLMVFGDVLTLKGDFGAGTGNKLYGVYSLPVNADEATIYSIDQSGNIAMSVNKETVILAPGQSYSYTENETLRDGNALIEVHYTYTYVNHGFIDKTSIGLVS